MVLPTTLLRSLQNTSRIRYVRQENQGLSASRNNGLAMASNEYVALLDADDEWEPSFIETLMGKIRELPDDFGLVACLDYKIGFNGERIPDKRDSLTGEGSQHERSFVKESIFPGAVLVRKNACGKLAVSTPL